MTDHLVPEAGPYVEGADPTYTSALARLLFPQQNRSLQMVALSSRRPEEAVYIRDKWDGTYVVATRLETSLWAALLERVPAKVEGGAGTYRRVPLEGREPAVEVVRAPIEKSLLSQLELLWREALLTTCHPAQPRIGVDGVRYHFALRRMAGQIWSPTRGSRMAGLVDVGMGLASYARAPDEQRAALEEELRADVSALRERFAVSEAP